jgi:hypothetical protein
LSKIIVVNSELGDAPLTLMVGAAVLEVDIVVLIDVLVVDPYPRYERTFDW